MRCKIQEFVIMGIWTGLYKLYVKLQKQQYLRTLIWVFLCTVYNIQLCCTTYDGESYLHWYFHGHFYALICTVLRACANSVL